MRKLRAVVDILLATTTRRAGYQTSLKIRKRVEEVFGWSKAVAGLRQTRVGGLFGWRRSTA